jgi:hypothetical protein
VPLGKLAYDSESKTASRPDRRFAIHSPREWNPDLVARTPCHTWAFVIHGQPYS